jgi:hypothetical protein
MGRDVTEKSQFGMGREESACVMMARDPAFVPAQKSYWWNE